MSACCHASVGTRGELRRAFRARIRCRDFGLGKGVGKDVGEVACAATRGRRLRSIRIWGAGQESRPASGWSAYEGKVCGSQIVKRRRNQYHCHSGRGRDGQNQTRSPACDRAAPSQGGLSADFVLHAIQVILDGSVRKGRMIAISLLVRPAQSGE